jgi:hypothetical protein
MTNIKHGATGTRLYRTWADMKARCKGTASERLNRKYAHVSYCSDWEGFIPFRDWAMANGYTDTLTIDRIDNEKGYCPENCRWATQQQQVQNRRKTKPHGVSASEYKGVTKSCSKKSPWKSRIRLNGKWKYLGIFPTQILAAKAYDAAAIKHFGEYACTNF